MIDPMAGRKTAVVILAAGKGKRMNSSLPKVLNALAGKPLAAWVVESTCRLNPAMTVVVTGYGGEEVREALRDENVLFATQKEQLGTAHAVMQAEPALADFHGDVMVLSGDVPFVRPETLERLLAFHRENENVVSLLSVEFNNPAGYGRIIRDEYGAVSGIVEEKDADGEQRKIREVNGGVYLFDRDFLFGAIKDVSRDNEQGEYYLTDVVGGAVESGLPVGAIKLVDAGELYGINTPEDLEKAETLVLARKEG
jgi:bifunctional UDP-N-acetylglucosamine pyrophosphorylase/glucosamine-1-phosphate N-acetyltransferase